MGIIVSHFLLGVRVKKKEATFRIFPSLLQPALPLTLHRFRL